MLKRSSYVQLGDFVRSKSDDTEYGYVIYIESIPNTQDYYVEVVYDEYADSLFFFDDELIVVKLIKE
jgi:hypothetical protein